MFELKKIPEDFIVKEINDVKFKDDGRYSYFSLKKKNYNTLRAIEAIANKIKINIKNVGFSGNKDKNALTEQIISVKNGNKNIQNAKLKDIELKYLANGDKEIFLGSHKGNNFEVTIRNLSNEELKTLKNSISNKILMPNYYGPQRLSNKNHLIGKSIIKKDFENAIKLILETNSDYSEKIRNHLEKNKNNFVGTLRIIPLKLLKLYVHSYQSYLFNKILEQYIENYNNKKAISDKTIKNNLNIKNIGKNNNKKLNGKNIIKKIPIIGFGTELNNDNIDLLIKRIIKEEKIALRDFIIKQIPELSSEGSERDSFVKVSDFEVISHAKDELNKNKEKITVKFSLPKGSYATVLIDCLFR